MQMEFNEKKNPCHKARVPALFARRCAGRRV